MHDGARDEPSGSLENGYLAATLQVEVTTDDA
jgi:hypothetical protein